MTDASHIMSKIRRDQAAAAHSKHQSDEARLNKELGELRVLAARARRELERTGYPHQERGVHFLPITINGTETPCWYLTSWNERISHSHCDYITFDGRLICYRNDLTSSARIWGTNERQERLWDPWADIMERHQNNQDPFYRIEQIRDGLEELLRTLADL